MGGSPQPCVAATAPTLAAYMGFIESCCVSRPGEIHADHRPDRLLLERVLAGCEMAARTDMASWIWLVNYLHLHLHLQALVIGACCSHSGLPAAWDASCTRIACRVWQRCEGPHVGSNIWIVCVVSARKSVGYAWNALLFCLRSRLLVVVSARCRAVFL